MFKKSVLFVVLLAVVASMLSACGSSSNVVETLRNAAQELFLADPGAPSNAAGKPMTRPEALVFWAQESGRLASCESVASKDGITYIKMLNAKQYTYVMLSSDKPECGLPQPYNNMVKALVAKGVYSTKAPSKQTASK